MKNVGRKCYNFEEAVNCMRAAENLGIPFQIYKDAEESSSFFGLVKKNKPIWMFVLLFDRYSPLATVVERIKDEDKATTKMVTSSSNDIDDLIQDEYERIK